MGKENQSPPTIEQVEIELEQAYEDINTLEGMVRIEALVDLLDALEDDKNGLELKAVQQDTK